MLEVDSAISSQLTADCAIFGNMVAFDNSYQDVKINLNEEDRLILFFHSFNIQPPTQKDVLGTLRTGYGSVCSAEQTDYVKKQVIITST